MWDQVLASIYNHQNIQKETKFCIDSFKSVSGEHSNSYPNLEKKLFVNEITNKANNIFV
jgi:hypothetical protein